MWVIWNVFVLLGTYHAVQNGWSPWWVLLALALLTFPKGTFG